MRIELPVNLDATLGCGQAHRWIKKDGRWEGVLGDEIVTLEQRRDGFECEGTSDKEMILSYFRAEDDLEEIYADISGADVHMARLAEACPGLRILRQDPWE
ncbi:MAG: 8-oxoguanine DNA glycosylase, N-terminal domain-containing protein, partial [Candidatus Thermoplasmatota archaeon]|nr:8-oxoguanine DNA glycosylase, N-terminal domain-containing protein [Candidatus Thermoplasmatota archaeon]